MTTANPLTSMMQSYYRQLQQRTSSSAGSATAAVQAATTSIAAAQAGKTDTATISVAALQALLDSEQEATSTPDAQPMTAQEALRQSRLSIYQAQQSFLAGDAQGSTDVWSQQESGNASSLMDAYAQSLDRQLTASIQQAVARLAERTKDA